MGSPKFVTAGEAHKLDYRAPDIAGALLVQRQRAGRTISSAGGCITTKEKGCKFVDARGPYSANNPQAIDAPRLYDQEGNDRGRLSTNTYDPDSISNPLGRYGSSISPESLNNPLGAGNPPGSPKNRMGRGWRIEGK